MSTDTHEVISSAGRIIRLPHTFTTGALARTLKGRPCAPASSAAVKWCAIGAVYAATNADTGKEPHSELVCGALATLDLMACRIFKRTLSQVCDDMGHDETMYVYERAWAAARRSSNG